MDNSIDRNNNEFDDSVSDSNIERNYSHLRRRNNVPLKNAQNFHRKIIAGDTMMKRSLSLCSVRTYTRNLATDVMCDDNVSDVTDHDDVVQFEHDALHNDFRRFVISNRSGTRNFVINPLFEENTTEC